MFLGALACLSIVIQADSALSLKNLESSSDVASILKKAAETRTITGKIMVLVDGQPEEDADVETALAQVFQGQHVLAANVGGGTYQLIFSNIPKDARRLQVTARVPSPCNRKEILSQSLMVDISKSNEVEIPINISTR